jgi:hypothetical protein
MMPYPANSFSVTELRTYMFLVRLLAYDLWSTGEAHRVTLWASALLIVVQRVKLPIGETAIWHAFATWAQNLGEIDPEWVRARKQRRESTVGREE